MWINNEPFRRNIGLVWKMYYWFWLWFQPDDENFVDPEYTLLIFNRSDRGYTTATTALNKQTTFDSEWVYLFKEKHPLVKIGFSKFCSLRPKWCVIAGSSGTHSVCVCTIHQNTILLVDALRWTHRQNYECDLSIRNKLSVSFTVVIWREKF